MRTTGYLFACKILDHGRHHAERVAWFKLNWNRSNFVISTDFLLTQLLESSCGPHEQVLVILSEAALENYRPRYRLFSCLFLMYMLSSCLATTGLSFYQQNVCKTFTEKK